HRRVSGEQLHLGHDRSGTRPAGDIDWPLCACAAPDVCGGAGHAARHTDCARIVVGPARPRRDAAGADLAAARGGKIPGEEPAGLCGVPKEDSVSLAARGLVTREPVLSSVAMERWTATMACRQYRGGKAIVREMHAWSHLSAEQVPMSLVTRTGSW